MWLVTDKAQWEMAPSDGVRGTEFAIRLLHRTRELVGVGDHWRSEDLAFDVNGLGCNPLSEEACVFSLSGAAARARWEMREELADAEINPIHVLQVMDAVFAVTREYKGAGAGWSFARAVIEGMESALEEYRDCQIDELSHSSAAA